MRDVDNEYTLTGCWTVLRRDHDGHAVPIESDLPEDVAHQMVADYAAEGEEVWMERTEPASE